MKPIAIDLLPALRAAIRTRRLALELSTVDAAAKAGISQPAWARLESAERELAVSTVARAARALDWSLSRLVREAERA